MIQWSLTLTQNQIAILEALEDRVFGEPHDRHCRISHWVTGVRGLLSEGLLEQRETKNDRGYNDPDRSGQFITERGRFVLKMIREDMARFAQRADTATACVATNDKEA